MKGNSYLKLFKKGLNIGVRFSEDPDLNSKWNLLKPYVFPNVQNSGVYCKIAKDQKPKIYWMDISHSEKELMDVIRKNKQAELYVNHLCTTGRYNINTNGGMYTKEKVAELRKEFYNGSNDHAYPMEFLDQHTVALVINKKKQGYYTLISEDQEPLMMKLFKKEKDFGTWYLKEKWITFDRVLEVLKEMYNDMGHFYKSEKVQRTNDITGVFEHLVSFKDFDQIFESYQLIDGIKVEPRTFNSECFMLSWDLNKNTDLIYGIYTEGPNKGKEFMEVYQGPNYKSNCDKNCLNYSRHYDAEKVPKTFIVEWNRLKKIAQEHFSYGVSNKLIDVNKNTGLFDS